MVCESEPTHAGPDRVENSHGETVNHFWWPFSGQQFQFIVLSSLVPLLNQSIKKKKRLNTYSIDPSPPFIIPVFVVIVFCVSLPRTIPTGPSNFSLGLPAGQWLPGLLQGWQLLQRPVQFPCHPEPVRGPGRSHGAASADWNSLTYLGWESQKSSLQAFGPIQAMWVKSEDLKSSHISKDMKNQNVEFDRWLLLLLFRFTVLRSKLPKRIPRWLCSCQHVLPRPVSCQCVCSRSVEPRMEWGVYHLLLCCTCLHQWVPAERPSGHARTHPPGNHHPWEAPAI